MFADEHRYAGVELIVPKRIEGDRAERFYRMESSADAIASIYGANRSKIDVSRLIL